MRGSISGMCRSTTRMYTRYARRIFGVFVVGLLACVAILKSGLAGSTEQTEIWKTLRSRCGTCSLVTNSGDLLGSYLRSKIERADCVFRINNAPTKHFEDDVGRKTTIRIVDGANSDLVLGFLSKDEPSAKLLIIYYDSARDKRSGTLPNVKTYNKEPVTLLHRDDDILNRFRQLNPASLPSQQQGRKFSIAFVSFVFSKEICRNELNIYGMTSPFYCDKYQGYAFDAPKHYYPPGNEETKCPLSRNFSDVLWTSSFDFYETSVCFKLAQSSDKIHFCEYTDVKS